MKVKLDENLPTELADLLSAGGHDVHTVAGESLAGRDDGAIFRAATEEARLLLTQDLDFSDVRRFTSRSRPHVPFRECDGLKRDLMNILCCPVCKGDLSLTVTKEDPNEVLEGTLCCKACKTDYPVEDGIPSLLPPEGR